MLSPVFGFVVLFSFSSTFEGLLVSPLFEGLLIDSLSELLFVFSNLETCPLVSQYSLLWVNVKL